MKKFFAAILTAVLGISALCAGEQEDIKAVIVRSGELASQGRFAEVLALHTPDFVDIDEEGTVTYEQLKWVFLALDGKHPEEFLLTALVVQSRGEFKAPTAEQMARIREAARDPQFLQEYKARAPQLLASFKDFQAFQLKTLQIVSITVDGDSAVAVIEYDSNASGGVKHKIDTTTLRKVDGSWKICKSVIETKK